MNLLTMLLGSFASDASVNSLSHKTGVSSSMLTKLIPLAIPILLKALTNNASSAGGAQSLLTALGQHSNKRSMAQQIDEVDEKDGEKIVHHILGKDSDQVVRALSRETGMKDEEVTRSLGAMAPALMSALSAAATSASKPAVDLSDGLDFSDLCGLFSGASTAQTQNNVSNMFGSLLGGPQQPQNNGGGLLGALLGGGQPAQPKPQNNGGSLLGALLGGGQPVQQQPQNNGGGLLGALLGGGQPAQPMQQPKPQNNGGSLLGALLGGGQPVQPVQQPKPQNNGGLLGALLGGGQPAQPMQQQNPTADLLGTLLGGTQGGGLDDGSQLLNLLTTLMR